MKTVFLVFLCVAVLFVAAIHAESDEDDVSDFEVERNESMELDEALRMNMGSSCILYIRLNFSNTFNSNHG